MRDWLNNVLVFIGTATLTDQEYDSINFLNLTTQVYNQAAYDELSKVLSTREQVSTMQARLLGVFTAKGATLTVAPAAKTNIYIGDAL